MSADAAAVPVEAAPAIGWGPASYGMRQWAMEQAIRSSGSNQPVDYLRHRAQQILAAVAS